LISLIFSLIISLTLVVPVLALAAVVAFGVVIFFAGVVFFLAGVDLVTLSAVFLARCPTLAGEAQSRPMHISLASTYWLSQWFS